MIVGELGVGITAVVHRQDMGPMIQEVMQKEIDDYGNSSYNAGCLSR